MHWFFDGEISGHTMYIGHTLGKTSIEPSRVVEITSKLT